MLRRAACDGLVLVKEARAKEIKFGLGIRCQRKNSTVQQLASSYSTGTRCNTSPKAML
eukprot:SAG11_NODE_38176_length_253_cov_1.012987_1_plen_57_part_01